MRYRRLGDAGMKVSEVALGGWLTFGRTLDEEQVRAAVGAAVDAGINFIDLADVYARGEAERVFGRALADHRRQDLVISSKAYWPMSDNINDRGLSRKHLFESIEGSLKRLGTDYVDIYFCHRPDDQTPLEETVRAMDDLVRQGKVLYWGTSVWPASRIAAAVGTARGLAAHPPKSEQPRYNMLDRHVEPEILPTCAAHGVGVVVWSPLAEGILTGKYSEGIPPGSRAASDERLRRNLEQADVDRVAALSPIAEELGLEMSQLALAWCLRRPEVSSVITGAGKPEHVTVNAGASGVQLDDEVLERIEAVLDNVPPPLPG